MKKMKYEYINLDLDYCGLSECIELLTNAFNKIPEGSRSEARFETDYGEEYGDPYSRQRIVYSRPETDEELEARLAQEKVWSDRRIAEAKKILGIKE